MVGLHAGTRSAIAVIGGVFVIAIADALSDALGIHLAQESDASSSERNVWMATIASFLSKFVVTLTFAIPVLLLPLQTAIVASVVWGTVIIAVLSFFIARSQGGRYAAVIGEHLLIAALVIVCSHFVGVWVNEVFA